MDIKTLIAEDSSPIMNGISDALDALRLACKAARLAGYAVRLEFVVKEGETSPWDGVGHAALGAVTDPSATPILEYKATIKERRAK